MKNSITSQATGGKKEGAPGPGFRIAHNYTKHTHQWRPGKHAKGKAKPNEQKR